MGTLSLKDEIKTLECPGCKKYITSDAVACRFCSEPITREMVEAGIEKEDEVIRKHQIGLYWTALITGVVFLFTGGVLMLWFFVSYYLAGRGTFFFIGPILFFLGAGEVVYALNGFYKDRPKKK
jgi:hypothetical protein